MEDIKMRNLTIQRRKCFVGCLGKIKVYIEDPTSFDIKINKVPCRKLGVLKHGEEKTFSIEDSAARIFMIGDKLSKNYCSEFCQIPEGQEDISLAGQVVLQPITGNVFRFDNNVNPEVLEHRKGNTRRAIPVLVVSVIIGLILGVIIGLAGALTETNDERVTKKKFFAEGMSITLTNQFYKLDMEDFTTVYATPDETVLVIKEDFSLAEGFEDLTLDEYMKLVMMNITTDSKRIETYDNLTGFVFDSDEFQYYAFVYKSSDAFWLIQFAVLKDEAETYREQVVEWAESVTFSSITQ